MKELNIDFQEREKDVLNKPNHDEITLSACLNRIMKKTRFEGYSTTIVEELKDDFSYVEGKLFISPEEIVILSCILENSSGFKVCDDEDVAEFMGCTNIEFISYRKYLDSLARKRFIRIAKNRGGLFTYVVLKKACRAIIEDKAFTETDYSGLNTEEMFSQMRKLFQAFDEDEIDEYMLLNDINMLVDINQHNIFSQKIIDFNIKGLSESEQRIFYYLCHRFVSFGDKCLEFRSINKMIPADEDNQKFFRHFQAGRTKIQENGLVCFGGEEGFMDKGSVSLSINVKEEFFSEVDLFSEVRTEGHKDLMSCENIIAKELYYNQEEQNQVDRLKRLLENESFNAIQTRLEEQGMRKGFNIILYGDPGTGKTETTLQIAKATGRDVFYIDMSKLKSKWVGDSEKAIKGVFNVYKNICKTKPIKPILFFNEADAILGKRFENVDSTTAQMYNTIQNIILQEMETIDGIMICTTNLHCNLDSAFERRFIYKIKLEKPTEEVRTKIWRSILKGLSNEEYELIARKYPFSGGEIENVVRKSTIEYVLSGEKVSFENTCKFCDSEMFKSRVRKIGF